MKKFNSMTKLRQSENDRSFRVRQVKRRQSWLWCLTRLIGAKRNISPENLFVRKLIITTSNGRNHRHLYMQMFTRERTYDTSYRRMFLKVKSTKIFIIKSYTTLIIIWRHYFFNNKKCTKLVILLSTWMYNEDSIIYTFQMCFSMYSIALTGSR